MDDLLAWLRGAAEPTRLRLLALAARGSFCVLDLTEILGQSQPRLSRHLRLLCEAGLLARAREGANVWFTLPEGAAGDFARGLVARLEEDDPLLAADRRGAARVLSERARVASEGFRRQGADWDEMRALGLPAEAVEAALLDLLPQAGIGRVLDIGTGTGRLLELLAPRIAAGLGVDASRAMLALARARLAGPGLSHCAVRQADMYNLPLPDGGYDVVVLQMVLHHAEEPEAALAEAARMLRPDGRLLVIELAEHDSATPTDRLAHRWPGFSDSAMRRLLGAAGFTAPPPVRVGGSLDTLLWLARPRGNRSLAPAIAESLLA